MKKNKTPEKAQFIQIRCVSDGIVCHSVWAKKIDETNEWQQINKVLIPIINCNNVICARRAIRILHHNTTQFSPFSIVNLSALLSSCLPLSSASLTRTPQWIKMMSYYAIYRQRTCMFHWKCTISARSQIHLPLISSLSLLSSHTYSISHPNIWMWITLF